MEDKNSPCTGKYNGDVCNAVVFKCDHCGHRGCQRGGCTKQQFKQGDECKDCGHAWEMIRLPVKGEEDPAANVKDSGLGGFNIRLPWPELVFGALAVITVAAVLQVTFSRNRGGHEFAVVEPGGGNPVMHAASVQPANVSTADICECYAEGFELHGKGVDVLSSQYATGFKMCRYLMGVDGGDAWTAGWNARASARPYETSCRAYRRSRE